MRNWIKLCESLNPVLPIDIANERASDIYTDLDICERVVWEQVNVIHTNELSGVCLGDDVPGIYGIHVTGDPEYWFNQLIKDYDRDALAYVIEINCMDEDVLVEDNCIMDKTESGDSHVLLTTREELVLGKDFKYVRTLTEDDLEPEYNEYEEDEESGDNGDESLSESSKYVTFNNQYLKQPLTTKIWTNPDPIELDEYIQTKPDKKLRFRYVIDNDGNIHFGDGYYVTHEMMVHEFPHKWRNAGELHLDKKNHYQILATSNEAYDKVKEMMNKSNKKEYDFFSLK